jgi:alpha-aminoadipate carrier protein LysW
MPVCPECASPLDIDEDAIDEGEVVICDDCGTQFEVVSVDPLELAPKEEPGYIDEDNDTFVGEEEE